MRIAIVGTVGVPGRYGGFETLVDNLVRFHSDTGRGEALTVYCSAPAYPEQPERYLSAELRYSRFKANGPQSLPYDTVTILSAATHRCDVLLLLGVSGAIALPLLRLVSRAHIVTNVDGIEWRRDKWSGLARSFLRLSERLAVRFSHRVIADNQGIADYLRETYGVVAEMIGYGGDHAVEQQASRPAAEQKADLPEGYALALCRIEPENSVAMILEAFSTSGESLVFVGNWQNSAHGRELREAYSGHENLRLLDPIYDPELLYRVRAGASLYVHGHSAGGTNPSLVEMMHFGVPIFAFDCIFNRYTTENLAQYFSSVDELKTLITDHAEVGEQSSELRELAQRRYTWRKIGAQYFDLLSATAPERPRT